MKHNLHRETENVCMTREAARWRLSWMLVGVHDCRIKSDCKAHLAEMDNDPAYVPLDISMTKMLGR